MRIQEGVAFPSIVRDGGGGGIKHLASRHGGSKSTEGKRNNTARVIYVIAGPDGWAEMGTKWLRARVLLLRTSRSPLDNSSLHHFGAKGVRKCRSH